MAEAENADSWSSFHTSPLDSPGGRRELWALQGNFQVLENCHLVFRSF